MLRFYTLLSRLGLTILARWLNNGHWYMDDGGPDTISCTCGLECCYWKEEPHPHHPQYADAHSSGPSQADVARFMRTGLWPH